MYDLAENAARAPSILEKFESMTLQEKLDLDKVDMLFGIQIDRLIEIVHGKSTLTKELEETTKDHPYPENRAGLIEANLDDMLDSIKSLSSHGTALTNLLDLLDGPQTIKKAG